MTPQDDRKNTDQVVESLEKVLADTYALLVKTHNYHWNVEGPSFGLLHELFEEQYQDLFQAVDDLAERIRALGAYAPGGLRAFAEMSAIADARTGKLDAKEMVADLVDSHGLLIADARKALVAAQEAGDEVTIGMIVDRLGVHEKNSWMLRSHLQR